MTSTWRRIALGDVAAEVTVGHVGPMASEYVKEGVPFLRSLNVKEHRIDLTDVRYVSMEFNQKLRKSMLRPGDVITVRTGKPGTTAVIPTSLSLANCSDVVITRPGNNLDPHWLSYYINGMAHGFVASRLVGAVQQHFNVGAAKEMLLLLPPIQEQRAIAATLGALDDKVDLNRQLVRLIPDLIRGKVSEALGTGGQTVPVSSLARFVNGGAYTKGASGTGRMVIRIAELNSGPGRSTVYNDIDVPADKTARTGDILMSWSGSLGVYRWVGNEAIINQHIFKVTPTGHPAWLVFDRLESAIRIFQDIAKDKATTMGHIKRGHLDSTQVEIPSRDAVGHLDTELGLLWDRLVHAEQECLTLERLREALLPELLSGRIRVADTAGLVQTTDD